MRKKGFTLIELLVVIAIIAMLLAILMPALNKVKKIAQRVVCGTNLKGLGTAQIVYANDYDDELVKQGGAGTNTWSDQTDSWGLLTRTWGGDDNLTVASSLYLLVREADVSPKSFVCPSSDQREFDPSDYNKTDDLIEYWDFGPTPEPHVSYSYHLPYSIYSADASRSAAFGLMADRNPFMDPKLKVQGTPTSDLLDVSAWVLEDYWTGSPERFKIQRNNAEPHDRTGQNVAFADGHNSFVNEADVGVNHDNVYTYQGGSLDPIRQGVYEGITINGCAPTAPNDSLLVNDSEAQ